MSVEAWLSDLGLKRYAETFAENGVELDLLHELTNDDLKDLGVSRLADRKLILKHIADTALELGTPSSIARPTDGERRQVTVLFADIVGYTQLSSELGAERTHALLNRYFEAVDGTVEAYGGTIDKHIGDNVMAVFGAPIAHHDDPFRALRAAMDIHDSMDALSGELGRPLHAHVGIASGQVVASGTGSHAHSEYTVTGDSVNLASRLQDMASPGETLISDNVRRAVMGAVDCASIGEVEVRGLDMPIQAWSVRGLLAAENHGADAAFIGRRTELAQFAGAVEVCLATGKGQTVMVRGEAGIGKTRMIEEFSRIAQARGFATYRSLILDFGVGKGRDAVRSVVRSLLGLPPGSTKTVRQAAADAAFETGLLDVERRPFLHDLLDLGQRLRERAMYDALDNDRRNAGKHQTIAELVIAASAKAPILVLIEDIHWARPLTLPYLATLAGVSGDCRFLLVMTSRVEGFPLDQAWRGETGGCTLMTLDLGPLRRAESLLLAGAIVDANNKFTEECVERSGGNPLFLEQLLYNAEAAEEDEVPASIQSLVLARMDRLASDGKRTLQTASVIGQRFSLEELRFLLDGEEPAPDELLEHQLIRPEGDSYLFGHAMIRDGVYASLLTPTRHRLHVRAAEWFADRDLELRAQHLERAQDAGAPQAYREAAEHHASRYHFDRSLEVVKRGRAIAQTTSDRFALISLHGRILNDAGIVAESLNTYLQALELASDDVERCESWLGIAAGLRLSNDTAGALALLERAEPVAQQNNLTLVLARLYHLRGNLNFVLGNVEACGDAHARGLEFARKANSPEAEARSLGGMGDATYARGRMASAYRHFSDCVTLSQFHGLGRVEVAHTGMAGWSVHYLNALQQALDLTLGAAEASLNVGDRRAELNATCCAVFVMHELNDLSGAPALIERLPDLIKQLGARAWEPMIGWLRACVLAAEGKHMEALASLEAAVTLARRVSVGFLAPRILGYHAMLTHDPDVRARVLDEAEEMLRAGSLGHNFLGFHRYAIDACLRAGDWDRMEHHASALEAYTRPEPLPSSDFFIARGRALAAHGRSPKDGVVLRELERLRNEAERVGLLAPIPEIDRALAGEISAGQPGIYSVGVSDG